MRSAVNAITRAEVNQNQCTLPGSFCFLVECSLTQVLSASGLSVLTPKFSLWSQIKKDAIIVLLNGN